MNPLGYWLANTDLGNALIFVTGLVVVASGWAHLRWHYERERYGRRLQAAVGSWLGRWSPRTVDRILVPVSWWLLVFGVLFTASGPVLAMVRHGTVALSESSSLIVAIAVAVVLLGGLATVAMMRVTGPPQSMRLVPREPTSGRDLMRQLAETAPLVPPSDDAPAVARSFVSARTGVHRPVAVQSRDGVTRTAARDVEQTLLEVSWADLHDAYGAAADVPTLLYAIAIGTDAVRHEAWWELWYSICICHQGTVYEVTPWCVPFVAEVAADPDHPDRVNALALLRSLAVGEGDHAARTRRAVERQVPDLLSGWQRQPELVQRALLILASTFPDHLADRPGLADLVPAHLGAAWVELVAAGGDLTVSRLDGDFDQVMARQGELEQWATAGWYKPPGP